jgi:hypothetical protein
MLGVLNNDPKKSLAHAKKVINETAKITPGIA